MATITRADLAEHLMMVMGLPQNECRRFVDALFAELGTQLVGGTSLKITGFGNFIIRQKAARPGRNPKTGESAIISARRVVVFKPGHSLKKLLR